MNGTLLRREELVPQHREAMYALLESHFEGTTRDQFESDLDDKNWVILLRSAEGQILGFSTILAYESCPLGSAVRVVCSGDTIVDPAAWRSPILPQTWIRSVHQLRASCPDAPFYWLLITSGFRTYRFLPVFWRRFIPDVRADAAPLEAALLRALATERFGPAFNPATGIVRLPSPQRLRPHLRQVPDGRAADPHIADFFKRNPGHDQGDELACLASLADSNLTAAGQRMAYGRPSAQPV